MLNIEVRCSGETPRCATCERAGSVCVYDSARRDRLGECVSKTLLLYNSALTLQGNAAEPGPYQPPEGTGGTSR